MTSQRFARPIGRTAADSVVGSRGLSNYLYLLPAVVLVAGLVYFSVGYTVWLSTMDWNGIGPDREFVGLDNFAAVLRDPIFWRSLGNVLMFLALVVVTMAIGFVLAVALHSASRLALFYKVAIFLPIVLAPAVMAPVFRDMFGVDGAINAVLGALGLGALQHAWLADPATAIWVLAAITIWGGTGFSFILYYAALTQVEPEILEAARVDGAGNRRVVWSILFPMVRSTTVTLIVLGTISILKIFDIPQIITQGGPANSTQFLATYIYQSAVKNYEAGYAAAITIVLVALCAVFAVIQIRLARRGEAA